jgi:hypothetical protein
MRPKKPERTGEGDLFRVRLDQILNLKHEPVKLAGKIDWDWIDREIAALAPMAQVGALMRERVLEELLAGEVLEIRVIDPALAHAFIR